MAQARNICFTVNHLGDDDARELDPSLWPHCTYCVFQLEMAPTTGQLHWQGYAEFNMPMRFTALHKLDGLETAHFEARKGTAKQASDYCKKEGALAPFVEWGTLSSQGARSDLVAVFEAAKNAPRLRDVAEEHPASFIRYTRGINAVRSMFQVQRSWVTRLYFYIGRSGCGKTRAASVHSDEAYWKPPGKWWDGYDGQEVVICDEFYGSTMPFSELLRLCDRHPLRVETKGGSVQFLAKKLIFTSNQHPQHWYNAEKTHQGPWANNPLKRRIDEFGELHEWSDITGQFVHIRSDDQAYGAPQTDNPFEVNLVDQPILENTNNISVESPWVDQDWPFIDAEWEIQFDRDQ